MMPIFQLFYSLRTQKTLGDIGVFLIPCLMFVEIRLIGRLFLPELVLLGTFLFLLRTKGRLLLSGLPKTLIVLGLLWLASQVITDIVRSTPFQDFSRGWANIGFFLIAFCAIYMLVVNNERRVLLFALGIIIGQFLQYLIAPNIYAVSGYFWKFGFGYALTFLIVISTQSRFVSRVAYLPEFILMATTIINWAMGARSLGAICFMVAVYLFAIRIIQLNHPIINKIHVNKNSLLILILLVGGVTNIKLYGVLASYGILGGQAQQLYESQVPRQEGKMGGVIIGGRQEMLVSTLAILDSPILGHGSWAKDPDSKYHTLLPKLLLQYGYDKALPIAYDKEHIPTHSFLLGAWVHSGLLGAIFWFWILVICVKSLLTIPQRQDLLAPIFAFICFNMLWNTLFSPLGAEMRLYTAFNLVFLMFMHDRLTSKRETVCTAVK